MKVFPPFLSPKRGLAACFAIPVVVLAITWQVRGGGGDPNPAVTATLSDTIIDAPSGSAGVAEPGETVQFESVISNAGPGAATNVTFELDLANHMTLSGPVLVSPLAIADAFPSTAASVLANDFLGLETATLSSFGGGDLGGTAGDHTPGTAAPIAGGGSFTLAADGSYTLIGPAPDPFTVEYRLSNATGTDTGTAIIAPNTVGRVWNDLDGNDLQDTGEPGVAGLTVNLLNDSGAVLESQLTNTDGTYRFHTAPGVTYRIGLDPTSVPDGYLISRLDVGDNDSVDSDADPSTGQSALFTPPDNTLRTDIDFGIVQTASVSGFVWQDSSPFGIRDANETDRVSSVVVRLLTLPSNSQVGFALTGADGAYHFTNVRPGDSRLLFSNFPSGWSIVPQDVGSDDTVDSDANPASGSTAAFSLQPGETKTGLDVGAAPTEISGRVWIDSNGNGLREEGEPGVPGVDVYYGGPTKWATTDSEGKYRFVALARGTAPPFRFDLNTIPPNHSVTLRDQGTDDTIDSDVDANGVSEEADTAKFLEHNDMGIVPNP